MTSTAQSIVVVLVGRRQTATEVQLSLAALQRASGDEATCLHVVHPREFGLDDRDLAGAEAHWWDDARSMARVTNDLLGSSVPAGSVFLVAAGGAVRWADLAEVTAEVSWGGGVMVGSPLDVVGLSPDLLEETSSELRSERGTNMMGVSVRAGTRGFVGLQRGDYLTLRGLDETLAAPADLLEDLHLRARRWGLRTTPGPAVLFAAKKLNALPQSAHQASSPQSATPIFRNLTRTMASEGPPLVSIVISTYNRSNYLADCINSILAQSFRDLELVLVDDGSTDATEQVVAEFSDRRIRYFKTQNSGISAARNFGLDQAHGTFIAVHDDDDLMLPWRIEAQLGALEPGDHGAFGVSVHFDDVTGQTHDLIHRLFTMQTALRYGNNPTHPTWLIRRDVVTQFGYDETLESGVDNNLALRMIRSGIRFRHTGVPLILRRMHAGQITRTAGETQKASASMSRRMLQFANGAAQDPAFARPEDEWLPTDKVAVSRAKVLPYLPDHLVTRDVTLRLPWRLDEAMRFSERLGTIKFVSSSFGRADASVDTTVTLAGVAWAGLVAIRDAGLDFEATAVEADAGEGAATRAALERWSLQEIAGNDAAGDHVVRLVSEHSEALTSFVSKSDVSGVAYQATTDGEQLMAVLLFVDDLDAALHLINAVEHVGIAVLDASVLVRGDMSPSGLADALAPKVGVTL